MIRIAIDGPGGAGKSTVASLFAEQGFCRIAMSHYDITVFR